MKRVAGLSAALALAASVTMMAQAGVVDEPVNTVAAPLEVTVSGFRTASGNLLAAVYADESGWDSGESVRTARVAIDNGVITLRFDDLDPGVYGLKMFQDLDGNNALDRSSMGIPTEPYGFSNNARGSFGPANWSAAAFTLTAGENSQAITLQ